MAAAAKEVFIVGAKRTAFGKFGGALANVSAIRLATEATKAALTAGKVAPELVDSLYMGNVLHTSSGDSIYLARHTVLGAGMPISTPAVMVNRLCGSGFEAIIAAFREIVVGDANVVVAGGVDCMSQSPYIVRNIRFGTKLGGPPIHLEDYLMGAVVDSWANVQMAETAENLAVKYDISREECDKFAYESHQRWYKAHKEGRFKAEIAPVTVKAKRKETIFEVDEHARPDVSLEAMAALKPVFKKGGTVTAATASGINDGAGAVILASAEAVKEHGLCPIARIVSYHSVGVPPEIMGIGPVPAVRGALKKAGLDAKAMDLVEINEAFAPQIIACNRELKFDPAKVNVCGGAVAIGHPLSASGSRIMSHLAHDLQRTNGRYAVGSACIGGGMGTAIIVEKC